uniref:Putative salivary secreted protein n=1 Tax=Ixodes ricinus TaxID=34613 RepID=A0A090XEB9_IXORI
MISTRVLLVFASLALACIAGGNTGLPLGCRPIIQETDFKTRGQTATDRPSSLAVALGNICRICLHKSERNITCLGDAGVGAPNCIMCCVCRLGDGNIQYNRTNLPNNFPCGPNKKCNLSGECVVSPLNHESQKLRVECFNSRTDYE